MSARDATVLVTPRSSARNDPSPLDGARPALAEVLARSGLAAGDPERPGLLAPAEVPA